MTDWFAAVNTFVQSLENTFKETTYSAISILGFAALLYLVIKNLPWNDDDEEEEKEEGEGDSK